MQLERIRRSDLHNKVMSAEQASLFIKDGMTVGMSGFTRAGEAKAVPRALAERVRENPMKINLMTGASLGNDLDKLLTESGALARRMPFQVDSTLRKAINNGEVMFIDQHLSETVEQLRNHQLTMPDVAVIEAVAITEEGHIVPTTSVGNSASFAIFAKEVIVEINMLHQPELEGLHDIYIPSYRPTRTPVPLVKVDDRIGSTAIPIDPAKIVGIVFTNQSDSFSTVTDPDADTASIARHLVNFFKEEVAQQRMPANLGPLQAGIGNIANAVMMGLLDSDFKDLTMYSEVLQDSTFDLIDAGKLNFASGCSIILSERCNAQVFNNLEKYRDKLVLRPQEMSNHPEIVRRLGIIAINTALEFDIYGNVNSTHVCGTKMMNGIGGSGDFARNAHVSVFVTKSIAKGGAISSVVPMVSHVDHTEHDVDILVTEQGLADLRGLAPRERAVEVIKHCVHPDYRNAMLDYYERACVRGGHTPHILEEAFSWHTRLEQQGTMKQS
ncbi:MULTISPECIES: acetyl-CoA hydrolase/transferase family protein [Pseudoalteromonas]|jgi:succinyl-CoA:acetate CoA-transferase|uniref:Acetyl-CoA hydrolase/transferase family protein n=2 Tax=Pseudoalteromonas TaxID=53246 RepID=A0AB39ATS1_9GAMM|nr:MULTISPECIES: acetyl-CoA hydrolase/transferase family protein [unclassified Pseudoalteromonas]PHQ94346.1 MAG: propionyl-CoA--succinate CoA transferase [Pseudoalteromonas sp.]ADT68110.1 propionyl-CoA:succinate-CoA transferase [Pseudoalteromonas sp. SM9913]KGK02735.1 succinate CoA transferase [Pseudoalteromonas sp. ND6B]MDN3436097.1 acetyl-CoA hydrolase/transferase family protein [Pseudoalteromonas sp. APC 3356]QWF33831.1 acetyl-CoA hydrolase/transferase family protein [Pseudoalteromonas sp. 